MKFTSALSFVALFAVSSEAFTPLQSIKTDSFALYAHSTREEFVKNMAIGLTSAFVLAQNPSDANAYKYAGIGRGSAGVLDPKEAIVDADVLASESVQQALAKVKAYKSTVNEMMSALKSDSQADLGSVIRKEFDFVALRANLNTLNSAFDEETQRGTDRLIRLVMQDLTELETANKQKPGIPRSEIRLNAMMGKLAKLDGSFGDFLAFTN